MTQEQRDRAFQLFQEALDRAPSERAAFLDSQAPDPEVRAEAESLLANSREEDPLLATAAMQGAREAIQSAFGAAAQPARASRRERLIAELVGTTVGDRYQIGECIGKGGYAVVFLAVDLRVGRRRVVVKVMDGEDANRDWMERKFRQEIEVLAKINHPGVVGISDCGRLANGQPFLVMNFVDGINLRERLKTPIGREEIAEIVRQMGSALAAAHALGVMHLDLKPENIMLARSGESGPVTVRLIDFGIARVQHKGDETMTNTLVAGTASYMAPEQFMGVTTPASDIYAMGVVCFEMLTGYRPQVLKPGHELPSGVGPRLTPAFDHTPEKRPANAEEFGNSLSATLMGRGARRRVALAVGAVAAIAVIAVGVYLWKRAHRPVLTDKDVLVLADFTNKTGDPVFDGTMREALAMALEQSPFLKILDDERMRADLKTTGRDAASRVTDEIAREICVRDGLKAVAGGSIARLGKRYAIALRVTGCESGDDLASAEIEADDKEHVLRQMSQAAKSIRGTLGESLSSIRKLDRPLIYPVTTASLEAFHAYSLGVGQLIRDYDPSKAIPMFEHAVELDPQFPIAWHLLGRMNLDVGDSERAREDFQKSFSFSERASERERMEIAAFYQEYVTFDLDKARQILNAYKQTYPRLSVPSLSLGNLDMSTGDFDDAVGEFRRAIDLDPNVLFFKTNLMASLTLAGRYDDAQKVLQNTPPSEDFGGYRGVTLALSRILGDHASEKRETNWFVQHPDDEWSTLLGAVYVGTGQLRQSERFLSRPVDLASSSERYAIAGDCERARRYALKSLNPHQVPDDAFTSDVALALCGANDLAAHLSEISARYPSATLWKRLYLPLIGAAEALHAGQPARAINVLQPLTQNERGFAEVGYLRGLAYLGLRNGPAATAEFQKLLEKRGLLAFNEIYHSASMAGLARAAVLSGDTPKAKKAYEDFFNLWKDADPDVPLLVAARKEYKALP